MAEDCVFLTRSEARGTGRRCSLVFEAAAFNSARLSFGALDQTPSQARNPSASPSVKSGERHVEPSFSLSAKPLCITQVASTRVGHHCSHLGD
ncbi:hypothetical protein CC85DRAFT_59092 [Cutaneotrichosporon oleaginosum]|uniref:Uncharacterized protein n=1 Tax=Cutaneotrichosporon oleaginosum TaxID=879819 RepID=A0A0J0XZ12_9TREE|nr:uncharacterized protein CC85DRAFT_59092 [Cutaneotrichosporon oleaginosum]KLT46276.1 hypothetical protein CC85DRAFT_59092 [Cutaneotrichosporon oleaginosum]TXT10280.1 hypothetical protein COLE_04214 [Cutaneotrichosporon oleaginosum]